MHLLDCGLDRNFAVADEDDSEATVKKVGQHAADLSRVYASVRAALDLLYFCTMVCALVFLTSTALSYSRLVIVAGAPLRISPTHSRAPRKQSAPPAKLEAGKRD